MVENVTIQKAAIDAANACEYYSPAILRLGFKVDDKINTMCIDRYLKISYNSNFVKNHSKDLTFFILHEVMHCINNHHQRFEDCKWNKKVPFTIANIFMDAEINQYIIDMYPSLFNGAITPDLLNYPKGKSFEYYLDLFMERFKDYKNGNNGIQLSNCGNNENNKNESDDKQQASKNNKNENNLEQEMFKAQEMFEKYNKIKDIITKSLQGDNLDMTKDNDISDDEVMDSINQLLKEIKEKGEGIGNSSSFTEAIRKIKPRKYPWRTVLKNIIRNKVEESTYGRDKSTFAKPNKRLNWNEDNIIFPSYYSVNKIINIVVGVDVSGSMGNLVDVMYGYLKSIFNQNENNLTIKDLIIVECDTKVGKVFKNFNEYTTEINSSNGGGTDMEEIPIWVENQVKLKKMDEPDVIIIMTDGYTYWNDTPHKYQKKIKVLTALDDYDSDCKYQQYLVDVTK